jgi:hypothetical protein
LETILQWDLVVTWVIRGQFIGMDFFENVKVLVVFPGYDGFDIWSIILWFLKGSVDFIEG